MKIIAIILLLFTTVVGGNSQVHPSDAAQLVTPILQWVYFSELPPGVAARDIDKEFLGARIRARIEALVEPIVWVQVSIADSTNTFAYDLRRRQLLETKTAEPEFLKAHGIRDGDDGFRKFLTLRVRVASATKLEQVSFETGGECYGRFGAVSLQRVGENLNIAKARNGGSKCCF